MSEHDLLVSTVEALMSDHCPYAVVERSEYEWAADLWTELDALGLTAVGVPEAGGGSGGDLADAFAVVSTAARFAAPVPLAETLLIAPWLREAFGAPYQTGPVSVATSASLEASLSTDGWSVQGHLRSVPFGHVVRTVLAVARTHAGDKFVLCEIPSEALAWTRRHNLADEPRDDALVQIGVTDGLSLDSADRPDLITQLLDREALAKTALMVGALRAAQTMTIKYAGEREQFGRTIGSFQAVRQLGAHLAGEVAVSEAAAAAALHAVQCVGDSGFPIAAARVRAASAATEVSRIAHQIHGAIGYTREHPLHHLTRRLWAWRDEGLSEAEWGRIAAQRVLSSGADHLWQRLVG
jgi:acyl-CoA dehydrogenase